ncbi:MAG: hypothetical protein IMF26_00415 [Candidatus Fermentithermobacillus carboniphilus]|uniref:Flagellar operon protein n=1 Tax=Candidatus Fermentithermobacillus carboniphilus TaxID=3085328 RepID=A0AAT9LC07_9FIRM|nr:MAG: hypothetical protein IMF26_00415 [Candidatus Fermentithermobacillus carboniphilus]
MHLKVVDSQNSRVTSGVQALSPERNSGTRGKSPAGKGQAFSEVLKKAQDDLTFKFSKHAEERLSSWGQCLRQDQIRDLEKAIDMAQEKGARSTLVVMKGVAFVVAPQSRTVVTVVPEERMKESIFTSIDSTVLVER